MRTTTLIGILLIVTGVVALGYQGITYTTSEDAVNLGPLKVTEEKTRTIPLPPIVGIITFVGGIVLLVIGRRK